MIELLVWMIVIAWATYGTHVIKEFVKHNWNVLK
jgi:hypothetical protein|tara:strand:+ start:552 stop:653 length:102 start_codon:yes stop_codon:yes gene_type:complete